MKAQTIQKGLTPRKVSDLIEAQQKGLFAHRHGLALAVTKAGTASWTFRYVAPDGSRRLMTLEPAVGVSITDLKALEARAFILRQQLRAGVDPLAQRHADKAPKPEKRITDTFEDAARRYIEDQSPHWKNEKHKAQWPSSLETYAYPIIGHKATHEITTQDVLDVLQQPYKGTKFWNGACETASRVRMRIETVLNIEFAKTATIHCTKTIGRISVTRLNGTIT